MKIICKKPILVFIPCYNEVDHVINTIKAIPRELHEKIECLIIDDQSNDGTLELLSENLLKLKTYFKIHLIRPKRKLGYAGSQKLSYYIASKSSKIKYVAMLHGDGQYDPFLLPLLVKKVNCHYALVNGYRDKNIYPDLEETPFYTYIIIRIMNWIENRVTGLNYDEWHSGFVIYKMEFLKKIPYQSLSNTPHIDGEMLICAGILNEPTSSVPIYKRYKNHESFQGLQRILHVLNTFITMAKFRMRYYHRLLNKNQSQNIEFEFEYYS